jgi:hypothetical protein
MKSKITFEEILNIENIKVKVNKLKSKDNLNILKEKTYFLPHESNIGERLYCLENDINEIQRCYCGNPVIYLKSSVGYSKRCSKSCMYNDPEVSEKRKNTCISKYGVSSFTKTKEFLDKTKNTNLEKYGVENVFQSKEIRDKSTQTNLEKYGAEHHMKSREFIKEFKQMNMDKFGVDNVSKLDSVKEKKKSTFQKNYGLDHIFSSNALKAEMFINKYGYSPYIPIELKDDFQKYKDSVWKFTYRAKRKLIENWDGYDYYDNQYIKENYKLDSNDPIYPSIDHKISVFYGFENKIDPSVIGSLDNLCITKRSINRTKSVLTESDFIKKLN